MSKLGELLYRFLLWFSVSFVLHFIASYADERQGTFLVEALQSPPNVKYGELLIAFAAVMFVVALMMFDIHRGVKKIGFLASIIKTVSYWMSKASSDLLLSAYGMASFLLGWLAYSFTANPTFSDHGSHHNILLGYDLSQFVVMLFVLGLMSLVVRIAPRARWLKEWHKVRGWLRAYGYLAAFIGIVVAFWI